MTNVIKFPKHAEAAATVDNTKPADGKPNAKVEVAGAVVKGVWVVTILLWPILRWIISLDCVFQFGQMMYYWDSPGIHAGWTFILHFSVLTCLTYFVSIYEPKDLYRAETGR
jgi:hypothetical protein